MRGALVSCCVVVLAVSSGCGGESPEPLNGWMQDAISPLSSTNLEIHYINVGWGGAVFVKGPGTNGAKILLEAGNTGMGTTRVVPYLQSIGFPTGSAFDDTI